jgi:hypothetical protein
MRSGFFSCYFNIPELGISESIPLTEYFPFRVLTPNSQNNTDTLKHQNGLSNLVNDKGRYHTLNSVGRGFFSALTIYLIRRVGLDS